MTTSTAVQDHQHLSFRIGSNVFALEISKVREVLEFRDTTKVPQTPDYMTGVINLRGAAVPVIDLNVRFSKAATDTTIDTCIIISDVLVREETITVGLLADSVDEVFDLSVTDIEAMPNLGSDISVDFISGMGKKDDEFVLLMDIDRIFASAELEELGEITHEGLYGKN